MTGKSPEHQQPEPRPEDEETGHRVAHGEDVDPSDAGSEPELELSVDDASLLPAVRAFLALARQLAEEEEQ